MHACAQTCSISLYIKYTLKKQTVNKCWTPHSMFMMEQYMYGWQVLMSLIYFKMCQNQGQLVSGEICIEGYLKVKVLVTQSCLTLCDPKTPPPRGGPSASSVHGIIQAGILEWVAILFSRGSSWLRDWTQVSCIAGGFFTIWVTRETPRWIFR